MLVSPDINEDLVVDMRDFARFGIALGKMPADPRADFNHDGVIDPGDLALFAAHYGHRCAAR